jgi:hypothetical protein
MTPARHYLVCFRGNCRNVLRLQYAEYTPEAFRAALVEHLGDWDTVLNGYYACPVHKGSASWGRIVEAAARISLASTNSPG